MSLFAPTHGHIFFLSILCYFVGERIQRNGWLILRNGQSYDLSTQFFSWQTYHLSILLIYNLIFYLLEDEKFDLERPFICESFLNFETQPSARQPSPSNIYSQIFISTNTLIL